MEKHIEESIRVLYQDTAPYLSDLEKALEIIRKAFSSGDPEAFLEGMLRSEREVNSADIRIILNRLRRKKAPT